MSAGPILPRPTPSYPVLPHPTPSHPILPRPTPSHPVLPSCTRVNQTKLSMSSAYKQNCHGYSQPLNLGLHWTTHQVGEPTFLLQLDLSTRMYLIEGSSPQAACIQCDSLPLPAPNSTNAVSLLSSPRWCRCPRREDCMYGGGTSENYRTESQQMVHCPQSFRSNLETKRHATHSDREHK